MIFEYNQDKDEQLFIERGVGFQDIIAILKSDDPVILDIIDHPNQARYPEQQIMYIELEGEVYAVPFVLNGSGLMFLKTIYPSRKARKLLLSDQSTINRRSFAEFITSND
jgi:hypothetical protein